MLKNLLRYVAKRRLENAIRHEEMLRNSAEYMRSVAIPAAEQNLRRRELDCLATEYLKGVK